MKKKRRAFKADAAASAGDEAAAGASASSSTAAGPGVEGGAVVEGQGKRRRKGKAPKNEPPAESETADEFEDDDEEDDEEEEGSDMDLDFELFDPNEDDYHSVGDLIKGGTWEFMELNYAELADSIVGQGNIGSLVKSVSEQTGPDKDEAVCGLLTALNLRQFASVSWPKTISEALLAQARKHAQAQAIQKMEEALDPGQRKKGCEIGLLLSERFLNLPPQLVPPLHRGLVDDIKWSCSTPECPPEERPFYEFTHFLGVTQCFEGAPREAAAAAAAAAGSNPPGKKRKKTAAAAAASAAAAEKPSGPWFPHPEDQFYMRKAVASFTFPLPGGKTTEKRSQVPKAKKGDGKGQELRAVFLLTRKGFEEAVAEVEKSFIEEAFA